IALRRSSSGIVGEVVVSASTRSPIVSCATRSTKVESTPPENATITDCIARKLSRKCSSLRSREFIQHQGKRTGQSFFLSPPISFLTYTPLVFLSDAFGLKEVGRQIAFAGIAEDHDHHFA